MVAMTPWGDVFDEFTARNVPYGFNHTEEDGETRGASQELKQLQYPDEDGELMGRAGITVTPAHLETRVERWNDYYNAKLRIIEGEIRDLNVRRGPIWHWMMLIGTAVFSFVVFLLLLAVDYAVLSEFWKQVYSNEFGEVPQAFVSSVVVKSLQVLGAALAFHFFYQNLKREGRRQFVRFVFYTTLVFLFGLGFLNAALSLPGGSPISPTQTTQSAADEDRAVLESLGLADETTQQEPTPEEVQQEQTQRDRQALFSFLYWFAWFMTLALLFVVVTSVAAMMLHVALRAISGLMGRIDNEHYFSNRSILNKRDMELRLLRARRAREWLLTEDARAQLMKRCLAAFEAGYIFGLYGSVTPAPGARAERRGLFGRKIEADPAGEDNGDGDFSLAPRDQQLLDALAQSMAQVKVMIDNGEFKLVIETREGDNFVEEDIEDELQRQQQRRRSWKVKEDAVPEPSSGPADNKAQAGDGSEGGAGEDNPPQPKPPEGGDSDGGKDGKA